MPFRMPNPMEGFEEYRVEFVEVKNGKPVRMLLEESVVAPSAGLARAWALGFARTLQQKLPPGSVVSFGKPTLMKRNPTLAILGNPGGRLSRSKVWPMKPSSGQRARGERQAPDLVQSERVYEIRYQHIEDGKDYKHEFAAGVSMYCLEDGAILLQRNDGKPLWEDFD